MTATYPPGGGPWGGAYDGAYPECWGGAFGIPNPPLRSSTTTSHCTSLPSVDERGEKVILTEMESCNHGNRECPFRIFVINESKTHEGTSPKPPGGG